MSNKIAGRRSAPLLVTGAIVIATFLFCLGLFIGKGGALLSADSLSSWVSAVATAAIGVLTFVLAVETWRLREAQTQQLAELRRENIRPDVSVALAKSPVGVHFMNVEVSNLGKGIARKIRFEFLDKNNNPVAPDTAPIVKVFQKLAMFRLGIESMGINQELKTFIFSFLELGKELNDEIFSPFLNMRIRFEDVEGNEYINAFVVDFAQYEGFSEVGGDPLHQLSVELKSVRELFAKVIGSSSNQRLSVNVFGSADREAEVTAMRKWMEEQRLAQHEKESNN